MPLMQTVHGRGATGSKPAAAAANEGYLFFDTTLSRLERSNGATWDVIEGTGGLADQGTATYLDFTTAAAPANPAAGKIRVYSKTGDTLSQRTSGGTETVFGAGGGGGITRAQVGTTSLGASFENSSGYRAYCKSVALASAGLVASIAIGIKGNASAVTDLAVAVYANNAGTPGKLLAKSGGLGGAAAGSLKLDATVGWVETPVNYWAPAAATVWIVVLTVDNGGAASSVAYAASGTDKTYDSASDFLADGSIPTFTTTARDYSIYANVLT